MNKLLSLGVFGTFGKPYGFQQFFYFDAVFNQTLDLNTNAITIYPSTELFSVKRELQNGINSICISKYSYAKEVNSGRGGTFIGSSILLREAYTSAENIYTLLTELHSDLISSEENIISSTLQVQQAIQLKVVQPKDFDNIQNTQLSFLHDTEYFSTSVNSSKKLLIIPNSFDYSKSQIISFIETSIKYFNNFETLYFTFDNEVINYVNQKGLLDAIDWKAFVRMSDEVINERAEKNRVSEEKKQRSKERTNSTIDNRSFTNWIYRNEKKWNRDQIKKAISEYNRLFDYTLELDSIKFNTQRKNIYQQPTTQIHNDDGYNDIQTDIKLIISAGLNVGLTLFLAVYFIFFNDPKIEYIFKDQPVDVQEFTPEKKEIAEEFDQNALTPNPNSELNSNDCKIVGRAGLQDKNISEIIEIIFSKNPTDIQSHYKNQKEAYSKELIKLNKDCFTKNGNNYKCICEKLSYIPSFKEGK